MSRSSSAEAPLCLKALFELVKAELYWGRKNYESFNVRVVGKVFQIYHKRI